MNSAVAEPGEVPPVRVFIVEDESLIALALEEMLLELGARVACNAGYVQRPLTFGGQFDLAILEGRLPDGSIEQEDRRGRNSMGSIDC